MNLQIWTISTVIIFLYVAGWVVYLFHPQKIQKEIRDAWKISHISVVIFILVITILVKLF